MKDRRWSPVAPLAAPGPPPPPAPGALGAGRASVLRPKQERAAGRREGISQRAGLGWAGLWEPYVPGAVIRQGPRPCEATVVTSFMDRWSSHAGQQCCRHRTERPLQSEKTNRCQGGGARLGRLPEVAGRWVRGRLGGSSCPTHVSPTPKGLEFASPREGMPASQNVPGDPQAC